MRFCLNSKALGCKIALIVRAFFGSRVRCWIAPPFERGKHITVYVETNNHNWPKIAFLYLKLLKELEKLIKPFKVDLMIHPFNSKSVYATLVKRKGIRLI